MKKVAAFYARVSSEKEMQLSALGNQLIWADEYAERNKDKYEFLSYKYVDKGITGTDAKKRPAFMKMIEDAKQGKFDIIIAREVSRFARNLKECLIYVEELKKHNVGVYFVSDNIDSLNENEYYRLCIMGMTAEEESRRDSERCKIGIAIARQKPDSAWGNSNVMGYKRKGRGSRYEIVPEEAETVNMIKDMYLHKNMGIVEIKNELERLGRKNAKGGNRWYQSTVSRILSNPFYCGLQRLGQTKVEDFKTHRAIPQPKEDWILKPVPVEALWTREEYEQIQRRKEKNRTNNPTGKSKGERKYFWNSKIVCSCGHTYSGQTWRRKGGGYVGYRCNNQRTNRSKSVREKMGYSIEGACDAVSIPEWKLEYMAKRVFSEIWGNGGISILRAMKLIRECYKVNDEIDSRELERLENTIKKLKIRMKNAKEMRLDGELEANEYKCLMAECQGKIQELEEDKEKLQSADRETDIESEMSRIEAALKELVDFDKPVLDRVILDKYVNLVYHESDYKYKWFVNLGANHNGAIPDEERIEIIKRVAFRPEKILKDKRKLLLKLKISYDEARAYRIACGSYMRPNDWTDLEVEVYAD